MRVVQLTEEQAHIIGSDLAEIISKLEGKDGLIAAAKAIALRMEKDEGIKEDVREIQKSISEYINEVKKNFDNSNNFISEAVKKGVERLDIKTLSNVTDQFLDHHIKNLEHLTEKSKKYTTEMSRIVNEKQDTLIEFREQKRWLGRIHTLAATASGMILGISLCLGAGFYYIKNVGTERAFVHKIIDKYEISAIDDNGQDLLFIQADRFGRLIKTENSKNYIIILK